MWIFRDLNICPHVLGDRYTGSKCLQAFWFILWNSHPVYMSAFSKLSHAGHYHCSIFVFVVFFFLIFIVFYLKIISLILNIFYTHWLLVFVCMFANCTLTHFSTNLYGCLWHLGYKYFSLGLCFDMFFQAFLKCRYL